MTDLLAKVFGIYMICGGIGMILRKEWAMKVIDEFEDNATIGYVTGAIILMAGSALVLTHNIWQGWPEIMVTLIGWGAAIEGALMLIYPKALFKFARMIMPDVKFIPVFGIGVIILGAALLLL